MTKTEVIQNYGSLSLAYVGDAVYEILVREYILESGVTVNGQMHVVAKRYVSAAAQSEKLGIILPHLTEDEQGVVRRGRNVKVHSHPKNVSLSDYHNATAFEALFGYLHLSGQTERISELFDLIIKSGAN